MDEGCSMLMGCSQDLPAHCVWDAHPPAIPNLSRRKCLYHYKYSRASLVVQYCACAPYPSPPPVFCDLSSFLYKAFYNPRAGGNAPHAWHWLHFLWIFSNRTLPDRRLRDPRSWQKYCPPWQLVCRLHCNRLLPCTDWQPDVYLVLSKCVQVRKNGGQIESLVRFYKNYFWNEYSRFLKHDFFILNEYSAF